ncbi:RNA polymerase sigma factor RpoD/SigA [bacterium]|nr:RNA polymerase sigma factor RpoD/SigA [bacterium]
MIKTVNNSNQNDALNAYMSTARKVPYLTAEQELALISRVKRGGSGAQRAQDALVLSHLRLVLAIARKYIRSNIPLEDLVQEGNLGLFKALEKFEIERGFRFATYAQWWVRQSINDYLKANGRDVRIPANRVNQIGLMNQVIAKLSRGGHLPSDVEVAREMRVSMKFVGELTQYAREPISINTPIFDGEGEFGDQIEDEAAGPEETLLGNNLAEKLSCALGKLNERERDIVTRRFGLDGNEPDTLEILANKYSLTRERVRQIEVAGLKKLAEGDSGRMLKTLL